MEDREDEPLEATSDPEDSNRSRGFKLRLAIEIPLIMMMFGSTLAGTSISNLMMYRTCVHPLNHSVEECRSFLEPDAINHTQELEEEVQEYTTRVTTVKMLIEGVGPAILSAFMGVWSDKHGRKPLLVWSMLGLTVSSMLTAMYSILEGLGPWWIILTIIPVNFSGAYIVMLIGAYCFISDISTKENRSLRIVLIQVSIGIASTISNLVSASILKAVGTAYLLLIVAALHTFAYAFTNIFIEESMKNATQGTIMKLFNISHIKEIIRSCLEKRPNYGRAVILLTVTTSGLSVFTVYGYLILLYLYSRNKIGWTMKDYTTFTSVSSAIWLSGSFFGIAVVQKLFRISDLNFVALSYFSCIAEYIIKALATTTLHMYIGSAVSLFGTAAGPLIRSFLTKNFPSESLGKIFAFMGASESFISLLSPVVYNCLYAATISSFPGSIHFFTSFINIICLILIMILQYLRWKTNSVSYQTIQTTET